MKSLIAVGTVAALAAFSSGAQTTFQVRDNFYMIRSGQSGN